jgi:hypothetical protein
MHNFGRGMWRRIADYEKQSQTPSQTQDSRMVQYFQMQKQRAIETYIKMKQTKNEVVTNVEEVLKKEDIIEQIDKEEFVIIEKDEVEVKEVSLQDTVEEVPVQDIIEEVTKVEEVAKVEEEPKKKDKKKKNKK